MNAPHILIVDNDILGSYALKEYFELQKYSVTVSRGCEEAKAALRAPEKVDVMVLDYLMPDGRATDLLRAMAENEALQKPFILMCSALIEPNHPAWQALCRRLPFGVQSLIRAYIGKPYTFEEIEPLINLLLGIQSASNPNEMLSGDYYPARQSIPLVKEPT